jgi:hypothetical protein
MAVTRYALMMLRYAQTETGAASFARKLEHLKRPIV